jgi:cysteine desulfurase/selenocysteine lyase
MDIRALRGEFPIFGHHKTGLIYLDNASTTHKPAIVIDTIKKFYEQEYATVHRALYDLAELATERYEQTREDVAKFINAQEGSEIIFTRGTTESINFIAQAWAMKHLKQGDEILITTAEHHANMLPWRRVAQQTGAKVVYMPIDTDKQVIIHPESYLTEKTKLVAITTASNVLGPIWDEDSDQLKNFIVASHKKGARVLLDAAQFVAHKKLDVQSLGADFVAFSAHKMFGPTGMGILYIKKELHDDVDPYHVGGSMIHSVTFEGETWAQSPQKFEAGTPPIAEVIGLGATIDFINKNIDFNAVQEYEAALCEQLVEGINAIPGTIIVGNHDVIKKHGTIVSFAVNGLHAHDIASALGQQGIAVRAGHHCAQPLVSCFNVESLLRASFAVYNTSQEIDVFLQTLEKTVATLKQWLHT